MDITKTQTGDLMHVAVSGRLDSYWSDHLSDTIAKVVEQGHHRIRLDCANINFLSSSGIRVLLLFHKQLAKIGGSFKVVNPSGPVETVLRLSALVEMLVEKAVIETLVETAAEPVLRFRRAEQDGVALDICQLDTAAQMRCRTIGSPRPLRKGTFTAGECTSLEALTPSVMVGVGAFGSGFDDCRERFGELLSVAGTTVYQPADGTNVADYLLGAGPRGSEIHVLYSLACEGPFASLIRFEPAQPDTTIGLARLVDACLRECEATSMGIVMAVETSGLIGATLRQSPVRPASEHDLFAFPGVRSRLSFTAERAFPRSVALIGGVVTRAEAGARHALLRPIGSGLYGHLHAAAFRFHPVRKGFIELAPTLTDLFDADRLLGVMHLLHDDRSPIGAGESEVIRGACWAGPIAPDWLNGI